MLHVLLNPDIKNEMLMWKYVLSQFSHVQLFVTLWTVDPPSFSVHGILQARILKYYYLQV